MQCKELFKLDTEMLFVWSTFIKIFRGLFFRKKENENYYASSVYKLEWLRYHGLGEQNYHIVRLTIWDHLLL